MRLLIGHALFVKMSSGSRDCYYKCVKKIPSSIFVENGGIQERPEGLVVPSSAWHACTHLWDTMLDVYLLCFRISASIFTY